MMSDNKKFCAFKNDRVYPCTLLQRRLQANQKKDGLFTMEFVNLETDKVEKTRIGLKSGSFYPYGFTITFCPFCGTRIDPN